MTALEQDRGAGEASQALGRARRPAPWALPARSWASDPRAWGLGLCYAWLAGTWHTFTGAATVVTSIPVIAATAVFLPGARRRPSGRFPRWAWALWAALALAIGSWEAWAFVTGSTHDHPTISTLVNSWMHGRDRRRVAFFGWLALGGWAQALRR